jgi:hypothetical protein
MVWLADAVVSAAVRRKIEEQQAREAAAEAAPDMSGAQAAAFKRQIADLLQRGETVTEALKRLRPPAPRPARRGGLEPSVYTDFSRLSRQACHHCPNLLEDCIACSAARHAIVIHQ